jgi:hypothetical protein
MSQTERDAFFDIIKDSVQLLNVAYLWNVPVDEQWRMSYRELMERINELTGRPDETPAPVQPAGSLDESVRADEQGMNWKRKAYAVLREHGVPFERAKSIANGIRVLAARYEKQIEALTHPDPSECKCSHWALKVNPDCPLHGIAALTPPTREEAVRRWRCEACGWSQESEPPLTYRNLQRCEGGLHIGPVVEDTGSGGETTA